MKVVRAYKKPAGVRNYYRTTSFSGFPKGSYLLPNPRHFHVAHYTNINRPMRPQIINLISGGRYSSFNPNVPHISHNWSNSVRPTVTINIANSRTITLDISMQTLREFIYPFAAALNINNLPDCKSTSCQTSYHIDQNVSITEITNGNCIQEDQEISTNSDTSCEPISEFELQILETMHNSIFSEPTFNDIVTDFDSNQTVVDTTLVNDKDKNEDNIELLHPNITTSHLDINFAAGDAADTQYQHEGEELQDSNSTSEDVNCVELEGSELCELTRRSMLKASAAPSNNEQGESIDSCLEKSDVDDLLCIADLVTNRALEIGDYSQFQSIINESLLLFKELPYQPSLETTEMYAIENTNEIGSEENRAILSCKQNELFKNPENLNLGISESHLQEGLNYKSVEELYIENVQNNIEKNFQLEVDTDNKLCVSVSHQITDYVDLEHKQSGIDENQVVFRTVDENILPPLPSKTSEELILLSHINLPQEEFAENINLETSSIEIKNMCQEESKNATMEFSSDNYNNNIEREQEDHFSDSHQQEVLENNLQHTNIYVLRKDSEYIDNKSVDNNKDEIIQEQLSLSNSADNTDLEVEEDSETLSIATQNIKQTENNEYNDVTASVVEIIESNEDRQVPFEDCKSIVINTKSIDHKDEAEYELNVDGHLSDKSDDKKRDIIQLECRQVRDDSEERESTSYGMEDDITNVLCPLGVLSVELLNHDRNNDIAVEASDCELIDGIKEVVSKCNLDINMHFHEPDVVEPCAVVTAKCERKLDFNKVSEVQKIMSEQIRSTTDTEVEDTAPNEASLTRDTSPNEASLTTDTSDTQNYLTADEHSPEQLNNNPEKIIDSTSSDIEADYAAIEYDSNTNSKNLSGFLEQLIQHENINLPTNEENKENINDATSVTNATNIEEDDFASDLNKLWPPLVEEVKEKTGFFCEDDATTPEFDNIKNPDKQTMDTCQNSRNFLPDSLDEGISDCKSTCTENITFNSSIQYDPKIIELSEIVFEYIVKQCYEVSDLVLFPEVLYDEHVVKMFAKLKDVYLNYYSDISDEFKNELRINMTDYILKKLECISPTCHNESEISSNFSDKLFTISEFMSDIFDKFFEEYVNGNESGGSWFGFTNLLNEKEVCHSTPESKISLKEDDKEKEIFKPIISSTAKDNTEDLTAFQKKKLQSGSELYWISINKSPKNVMETTPRKAVVINVDDIPLKPPADLVSCTENHCKRPLSPILEEAKCNLFNEFQENNPLPRSKVLSTYIENFEYKATTDFLAGGDYVQFDKPENDVVLINEAKFFRGPSSHHACYIQSSSVTFHPNVNCLKQNNNNKVESTHYSMKRYADNDEGNWMGYENAKF